MRIHKEKTAQISSKPVRHGTITQRKIDGYPLELLELLDQTIRDQTGNVYEPLRKYVRQKRDPMTSTVLRACREHNLQLVIGRWSRTGGGIEEEHRITSDKEMKRFCNRLRERTAVSPERDRILLELSIPQYRIYSWTRAKSNNPRFSDLVRLADRLYYYIHWYDASQKRKVEVF